LNLPRLKSQDSYVLTPIEVEGYTSFDVSNRLSP
jgi:hypothetical protein